MEGNCTKIAATGSDNNVRVYQLDGKLLLTLAGHAAAPKSVAFSSDNTRLVSSGPDNLAIAWDVATGAALESIAVAKGLSFARFGTVPTTLLIGSAALRADIESDQPTDRGRRVRLIDELQIARDEYVENVFTAQFLLVVAKWQRG